MSFGNKTSKFNGIKNFGFIKDKKILRKFIPQQIYLFHFQNKKLLERL